MTAQSRKEPRPPGTRILFVAFAFVAVAGAALLVFSHEYRTESWVYLALGLLGLVQTSARASSGESLLRRWKRPLVAGVPALLLTASLVYSLVAVLLSEGQSETDIVLRVATAAASSVGCVLIFRWWRR